MKIGLPKERLSEDLRVAMLPSEVKSIVNAGHEFYAEKDCGLKIHISNEDYENAGAMITNEPINIYNKDIVIKIKAPSEEEFGMLGNNVIFSMLHTEQNPNYIEELEKRNMLGIEIESIINDAGERFINATDITAEQGILYAFHKAEKSPSECKILILGYGRVGSAAATFTGKFTNAKNIKILRRSQYPHIEHYMKDKDLIINAISWPKSKRDRKEYAITKEMLSNMNPGGILLDLSVDYPSPIETSRPTQLNNPSYIEEGIRHIAIYGYPGFAPVSCSERYSKQIEPLLLDLLENGFNGCSNHIKNAFRNPSKFLRKSDNKNKYFKNNSIQ